MTATGWWEKWTRHPVGVTLRVVLALAGVALASLLIWLANFAASYKKTPSVWDGEALTVLTVGLMVGAAALLAAFRPSKRNTVLATIAFFAVPVAGAII